MARPRKPEVGSAEWARKELAIAENRLRLIRQRLAAADESELSSLLRLEMAARREIERLAKLAAPQVLTEPWNAALADQEAWEAEAEDE